MIHRQTPNGHYTYPSHRPWWSKLLWRLGFDPLTTRERLAQVQRENEDWKRWEEDARREMGAWKAAAQEWGARARRAEASRLN